MRWPKRKCVSSVAALGCEIRRAPYTRQRKTVMPTSFFIWLLRPRDQTEHFAHLLKTNPQEEAGVAPIALRPQDEEVGLGIPERFRAVACLLEAILPLHSRQRCRQLHRAQ